MGLLDGFMNQNDPQSMGLLTAASQILQGSGQTRQPFGLGQAMGVGIQGYQQGSQMARDRQMQEAEHAQREQMRKLQMEQEQREQAQAQMAMTEQQRLRDFYAQPQAGVEGAPQQGAAPGQQAGSGESLYDQMMGEAKRLQGAGFIPQAQAKMKEALSVRPKYAMDARTVMGPDGKPMLIQMADDGTARPIQGGYGAAEKLHFGDNGQNLVGMDQYTGQVKSSLGRQQTLESAATERSAAAGRAVTVRGQNMTDKRARELTEVTRQGQRTQIINDPMQGPLLIDKGTGQARQAIGADGKPIQGEAIVKKEASANSVLPLLGSADKLIESATGSYAGAGWDQGARLFGSAPEGAKSIAQLKVIEGQLMMGQPRMEGPQSNMDVQLYRQMAGQIGDPTVPSDIKKAAISTIRTLTQKYASPDAVKADDAARNPAPTSIPREAATMLKMNPKLRAQFDEKYGAGAAASVLGK